VTDRLRALITHSVRENHPIGLVICAGPVPMMRAVAEVTRPLAIKTIASLNPIMVDGTGMCGGCRVRVDGVNHFACVDGPEFDAHATDFGELSARLTSYREHERLAFEQHACQHPQQAGAR
jgi:ferredoxin--NADP+ reductase